jgi:hypothetical protein
MYVHVEEPIEISVTDLPRTVSRYCTTITHWSNVTHYNPCWSYLQGTIALILIVKVSLRREGGGGGSQGRHWRCRQKKTCPATNKHSIPSGWFRRVHMPDNITVQVRSHPSSREPVTTANRKAERRQASISAHSCRLDLRNDAVWWLVSLLLISEVRKHLSRFEVSCGFPFCFQTNVS